MPLPECVKRLLPDDLPFQEIINFNTTWTVKGTSLNPILKTLDNAIAICDTEEQVSPSMREPLTEGYVWYSVDRIEEALKIARRLGIDRIFFSHTAVNGKTNAPLAIVGKNSRIAIVVAPHIAPSDEDEEEEWEEDI
mgnify:CR=1 FL=1